ncbi:MAG: UDP-N-acetylglucosamine 2-epimerase (non-hydrolyzing) [Gemmatimonadales bacterium]|nr:UDP-N-acetylglucosamine 2-epimerase (non-hydrolyzing) [Gemmatimonadales bacterium]
MRIVTVVGARPQFIKAAALSSALAGRHDELIVHTGQHHDHAMSGRFFEELGLPRPAHQLAVHGGSHGHQTGAMLAAIEDVLLAERPDLVLVYGDTNSTLAGALAAAKLHLPIAHVEAGLRSFNRRMPEEVNRVLTDHLATLLFAPAPSAVAQLAREGITAGVHEVGDIMLDVARRQLPRGRAAWPAEAGARPARFAVATIHRAENTDDAGRLSRLVRALGDLGLPVLLPLHPRTAGALARCGLTLPPAVRAVAPLGHAELLGLARDAHVVLTDSGGLQKEAYFVGTPCITLRGETEWVETVATGWNVLVDADSDRLRDALRRFEVRPAERPPLYGEGDTAERIAAILDGWSAGAAPVAEVRAAAA